MYKILIVDDEPSICSSLRFALEDEYEVFTENNEKNAITIVSKEDISIVLLDLRLGRTDGIKLLSKIKSIKPDVYIIMMTAYGTIESAVEAVKSGAFYYITKPINMEELNILLIKVQEYMLLNDKVKYLTSENQNKFKYDIVASSKKMLDVFELIEKTKNIDSNILITGESGTGKELVARALHFSGDRKSKPYNVLNCAAIPNALLESELFGVKKGSYTGAFENRDGIISLSEGGTLFLDEIGDMNINLQTKLLRVIENKEIAPIGATKPKKVDVRFVFATNKNLSEEVNEGRFRKDLFYRINVININIPPLRERKEDIPKLVEHFIRKYNVEFKRNIKGITMEALGILEGYEFDGNVRELGNIIERAVALTKNFHIEKDDLPEEISLKENRIIYSDEFMPIYEGEDMKAIEVKAIKFTLEKMHGNRKNTSEALGISERSLRYKIKEHNIK